jgi:hypothetical protein
MLDALLLALLTSLVLALAAALACEITLLSPGMAPDAFARLLRVHDLQVLLFLAVVGVALWCASGSCTGPGSPGSDPVSATVLLVIAAALANELPVCRSVARWRRWARALPGLVPPRPWEIRDLRRRLQLTAATFVLLPLFVAQQGLAG